MHLRVSDGEGSVSPPTRGWTPITMDQRRAHAGFPAHAGMDPDPGSRRRIAGWFPRPRGDGPMAAAPRQPRDWVSPPTRGWTHTHLHHHRSSPGFPAHAGMDLYVGTRQDHRLRFPRPRGDGPCDRRDSCVSVVVSPPTRGWTSSRAARTASFRGFPAHAGMDRHAPHDGPTAVGFPRPRGDGPRGCLRRHRRAPVSPPTRGWTSHPIAGRSRCAGFPAHAGMDLVKRFGGTECEWFPRPRGDGPPRYSSDPVYAAVSPPTRGWTPAVAPPLQSAAGFPAHAGMDPSGTGPTAPLKWFPRPRGDGPFSFGSWSGHR